MINVKWNASDNTSRSVRFNISDNISDSVWDIVSDNLKDSVWTNVRNNLFIIRDNVKSITLTTDQITQAMELV